MGIKRVTVKDIAQKSGYSVSTVSKTLNGTDRVGAEAIEKIKKIADELGYRSSFSAQSLARRARKIAILLFRHPIEVRRLFETGFSDSFDLYGEFGIEPVYHLFDNMNDLPWNEIAEQSDAVIVTPGKGFDECFAALDALGKRMPLVMLQTHPHTQSPEHLSAVTVNARVVGMMAAQFLSVCVPGGKTAVITGYSESWIHRENIRGFLATSGDCGLENLAVRECFDDMDRAYAQTAELLDRHADMGAIFVTSYVSPAVCRCIVDRGRKVRVIGVDLFANSASYLRDGSLDAALFQNQQKQAQLALEAVVNSFRNIPCESNILVKPELVMHSNLSCYGWD